MRTARAKGLPSRRVVGLHALRNALIPVVTIIGLQVGALMAGAVLTETIFSWPGVGKWLIESIGRRDYPALQGGVMLISTIVMLVNLLVDPDLRRSSTRAFAMAELEQCDAGNAAGSRQRSRSARAAIASARLLGSPISENRGAVLGARWSCVIVVLLAILADVIAPYPPNEQFRDAVRAAPAWADGGSMRFVLGTDGLGRDMLSRLIHGARISLFIGLSVMGVSFVIGGLLGPGAACSLGSAVDVAITRVMDLIMAVPSLVLAILVRRRARPEPHQHDRRGDHRLSAALRAAVACRGAWPSWARTTSPPRAWPVSDRGA